MAEILKQRVPVNAHQGDDSQGNERQHHEHNVHHGRHGQPEQLRIAHKGEQEHGFHRVSRFQHPAEELAGVRIVCGNGEDII